MIINSYYVLVIKLINDNKRLKLHAATCLKVAVLNTISYCL